MNNIIKTLIETASSADNLDKAADALNDLGLLVERHTQERYAQEMYLALFGNNFDVYNLLLTDDDLRVIVDYFFFHIMNIDIHPVTAAWCLGKCYHQDILKGMNRLLYIFSSDDDVSLQLIYSINALYDLRDIKEVILPSIEMLRTKKHLPKTNEVIEELSEVFDFLKRNSNTGI